MARSIRVEDDTYRKLCEEAGKLQSEFKRPVSVDETISFLLKKPGYSNKISDLAGSWDATNGEIKEIRRSIREGWKRWKPRRYA